MPTAVRRAWSDIAHAVTRHLPEAAIRRLRRAAHGYRRRGARCVGARWDPQFGAVVIVGAGGVFVELLHDVRIALAPVLANRCARSCVDEIDVPRPLLRRRARPPAGGRQGRWSMPSCA